MSLQSNFLISASAGTGKTFALASHIIRLILAGEAPHNITALTFSRAAAAEIFNRVVKRLAEATTSEIKAAEEGSNILASDCPDGVRKAILKRYPEGLTQTTFIQTLREFLADQHRSQLGTIDAFLTRIVTLFPSEVGLEGAMTMLDDDGQAILRQEVAASVFSSTDEKDYERLRTILTAENDGDSAKTFLDQAVNALKQGRDLLYKHLNPSAWGDPKTIFGNHDTEVLSLLALDEKSATQDFKAALDDFVVEVRENHLPTPNGFASEYLTFFHDTLSESPYNITSGGTKVDNFLKAPLEKQDDDTWLVKCKVKAEHIHLPYPLVEKLKSVIRKAQCIVLASKLRKIRGRYVMLMNLELAYHRLGLSQGKLSFSDITRLVAQSIASNANSKRELEYRFDTLIRHLALDEFQDTAPIQWKSLLPIVNELKQSDDGRSLFVVGDLKQAIYGWRGGDYRLFKHELESSDYNKRDLVKSFRFRPEISNFANKIFSPEAMNLLIVSGFTQNIKDPCRLWGKFWVQHSSAESDEEKPRQGYVHVERAQPILDDPNANSIEAIARLIASRLLETQPWKRGLSSAILVRDNKHGNELAQRILEIDSSIPIAFESQSSICDSPILGTLLDLLVLSEHPLQASCEWGHLNVSEPIAQTLYPNTSLVSIPSKIANDRCKNGLAATLSTWTSTLLDTLPHKPNTSEFLNTQTSGPYSDDFRDLFENLVAAASEFALDPNRSGSMLEFRAFVFGKLQRNSVSDQEVKILTQHRSKGLTFDQIFVPFFTRSNYEPSIGAHDKTPQMNPFIQTDHWILEHIPSAVLHGFAPLEKADKEKNDAQTFEDLCTFYVSTTRPKAELFIALPPEKKPSPKSKKESRTWSFPQFLENILKGLPYSDGNPNWYTENDFKEDKSDPEETTPSSKADPFVNAIKRSTPSQKHPKDQKASDLFYMGERATERGTSLHERLAQIEWLEPDSATQPDGISQNELDLTRDSNFRRALERPDDATDLWRERSFEILHGDKNEWVSGTFDRVVFRGSGKNLRIELYDFKTNRQDFNESTDAFHHRMHELYKTQMEDYRNALHRLTGVPLANISTTLLFSDTRTRIDLKL